MEGVIRQQKTKREVNEKEAFFERLYWVIFQIFIKIFYFILHYIIQNNTFWCGIISTKQYDVGG